ncbi:MAG: isochorismatase family cysteine hydrolase [Bryobacterales bacterium]|nr:isochorismatase family cysteine hydrolase [Bryobacterales bacterium]
MRTVFFDVDTQMDFLVPAGALYVPGAENLLPAWRRLRDYAVAHGILIVSSTDAHEEDDPEFAYWPPHCVRGTVGQQKPPETLAEPRLIVPLAPGDYPPGDARQIVVEKQALDVFTNPNLPALLDRIEAARCVVYGLVTEYCVRCAALGLLGTGRRVELVTDAVRSLDPEAGRRTLDEILQAGGRLTTVAELCGP